MVNPIPLPDAVQWSEGMLLSPQHLQQNDIYWHAHLRHRLANITPYYWGVSHLQIDTSALVNGLVKVIELECVLPEGLAVSYPGKYRDLELSIPVNDLVKSDGRPVRIWVQAKARGTAAARADNADRRYNSIPGEMTPDENTGDGDTLVARLQTYVTLAAGDATTPPTAGEGACPLLDVVRDAHGHLRLAPYYPPLLRLAATAFLADNHLQRLMTGLMQRIWAKLEELADNTEDEDVDSTAAILSHRSAARMLARALPALEIIGTAADTHPAALYSALALMVGEVSGIGDNPLPLKMKPYSHENCFPQFQAVIDHIDAKLALLNTVYECLQFKAQDVPGVGPIRFTRVLSKALTGEILVELKAKDGQSGDRFLEWLNAAIIVADSNFHTVEKGRLRGAVVHALSPQEMRDRGLRARAQIFRLESKTIPVQGMGMQPSFRPGQMLLIHGPETSAMPLSIVLHQKKDRSADAANGEGTQT